MRRPQPLLFLDFDGVINNLRWLSVPRSKRASEFDPVNMAWLNALALAAKPAIAISSAWRDGYSVKGLRELLADSGFEHPRLIIGKTRHGSCRGEEIRDFCWRMFTPIDRVVILDDDSDMASMLPRLVQTNFRYGLRRRHVRAALKLWGISSGRYAR